MTLFEYLSIAVSLVLSFTVMRIVEGLPQVLAAGRRWWVHGIFTLLALFSTLSSFWVYWSYRNLDWNFLRFLLLLGPTVAIYFIACTLVPRDAESVESWKSYFAEVASRFFIGWLIWALMVLANQTSLGAGLLAPMRVLPALMLALSLVGLTTRRERVWAAISLILVAGSPLFVWGIMQPSPLLPG